MKRVLTILICLVLMLSIMPIEALALSSSEISSLEKYFRNSSVNIEYGLVNGVETIIAGEYDLLTVMIYNRNGETLNDATVSLDLPAGISISSGAARQVVGRLRSGGVACVDFPIVADADITAKSVKITATVEGYYWTPDTYTYNKDGEIIAITEGERKKDEFSESFFVPITGGEGAVDAKNPILLLSDYSCGGSVVAGSTFNLSLTLTNTSKIDLHNIKVSLTGTFVPVGSSNSFYIESIPAGETASKTLKMSCARDVAQGQYPITVATTYNEGSATDTISVPVVQETRLVIDDILDPGWLTMADTGYGNVSYRNMGNNQINNLTISVEGDFDLEGNPVYYVGNMASGRQDTYSFNFYPRQVGACSGTVKFTYEDADGNEHYMTKDFTFNIGEAPVWDDPGEWDEPIEEPGFKMPIWGWAIAGVVFIVVLIVVIKLVKKRKAKKQEAFDLDE